MKTCRQTSSCLLALIMLLCASPLLADQRTYRVDGYEIILTWEQYSKRVKYGRSGDWTDQQRLSLHGDVSGGKACNQLNVKVGLSNTADGDYQFMIGAIHDYQPKWFENEFRCEERTFVSKRDAGFWVIDKVFVDCLD